MSNDLLTAQEVADYLKLKKTTVYEMIKRGDLPSTKIGKQLRIARTAVEQLASPEQSYDTFDYSSVQTLSGRHRSIVLCGQDISLDIIANYISAQHNVPNVLRSHAGSYNSLMRLYHGRAAIATAHLWDAETDQYNLPFLSRLLPGMDVVAVRMFGRSIGFYVKKGNPKGIYSMEDLAKPNVLFCNRETGSGTRILLDSKLKALRLPKSAIAGYSFEQTSHFMVAGAVSRGEADVGLGIEAAALQVRDVEFIPLQLEWYDMIFAAEMLSKAPYANILEFVSSTAFRRELEHMGNYDFSQTGQKFIV